MKTWTNDSKTCLLQSINVIHQITFNLSLAEVFGSERDYMQDIMHLQTVPTFSCFVYTSGGWCQRLQTEDTTNPWFCFTKQWLFCGVLIGCMCSSNHCCRLCLFQPVYWLPGYRVLQISIVWLVTNYWNLCHSQPKLSPAGSRSEYSRS